MLLSNVDNSRRSGAEVARPIADSEDHDGRNARIYDGSIQDWTTKKFPTVTGR